MKLWNVLKMVCSTTYFFVWFSSVIDASFWCILDLRHQSSWKFFCAQLKSQMQKSYFVKYLSVAASIKGLLLYIHINFKCKFQELRQGNTSKTAKKWYKKKKMLLKRQRYQVRAHLLWRRHKKVSSRIICLPKCRDILPQTLQIRKWRTG